MTLVDHLLELIQASAESVSEYQLLQDLKDHHLFVAIDNNCQQQPQLALFRKHFTLMNALYQLQAIFWQERRQLTISALEITLSPPQPNIHSTQISNNSGEGLRSYYLDWDNYLNTSVAEVDTLLGDFWLKYSKLDRRQAALEAFDLDSDASRNEITLRYRQLMNIHHPDRGGNSETFIQLREAWEILRS